MFHYAQFYIFDIKGIINNQPAGDCESRKELHILDCLSVRKSVLSNRVQEMAHRMQM